MRETAALIGIGVLTAGILGSACAALACDKQTRVTGSTCSTQKVTVAAPATCVTASSTPAPTAPAPTAAPTAGAEAGMRAYIDPETGTIGGPGPLPPPSDAAVQALEPTVQEEPVETVLPDGSVMLDLKGRGQEYFILQVDTDGRRVVRCVEDPNAALHAPPTAKREER